MQVRIFDDRLEVWNPGTLPPELSIDSLYKAHASRPRNPRFAQALHIARLIEHWGTGTLRMIDACAAHNLPRPVFALEMGSFIVTFLKELRVQRLPHYDELNNRQRDVLRYLRDSTRITNGEYQQRYSISARQSVNDLDGLVHAGFVIRGGAGRATYYQLVLSLSGPGVVWDEGG